MPASDAVRKSAKENKGMAAPARIAVGYLSTLLGNARLIQTKLRLAHPRKERKPEAAPMNYEKPKSGEWVQPVRKGYKMACCDCGLVHTLDFRIINRGRGKSVQFRAFRDNRATAAIRRGMKGKDTE